MKETKWRLIKNNGCRCMLCGKTVPYEEIQWHHIFPRYASKRLGELPDDSYENGSLLCRHCHIEIHHYLWWDDEYQVMTDMILANKK